MVNHTGNLKHGGSGTLTYARWRSMIARCNNKNATNYKYYGAKGVTVSENWLNFASFLKDMGECPSQEYTLDRLNNELGYEFGNCRWATKTQQNQNRPNYQVSLTFNGKTQTITEWAIELGLKPNTLATRIKHLGWSVEKSLTQTVKKRTVKK
jgi:hypothetical protein